jgi:parvulin-like peptidyl-prolyl isomerase
MRYFLPFLAALAVCAGCDLLDPAKVGDPVFAPPPPRSVVKSDAAAPNAKTADVAVVQPNNAVQPNNVAQANNAVPPENAAPIPDAANNLDITPRGSAPDAVMQTSLSDAGRKGPKGSGGKMTGNEIVASINGQALFASEIFERAAAEPLTSQGMNLLYAAKLLSDKQITEQEYRELQMVAIRKFGKDYVRTRVLAQAMVAALDKDQQKKLEDAVIKEFDNYLDRLRKDFNVMTSHEVDIALHKQGTTLDSLKAEFRNRLLADEYLRGKSKKEHIVGHEDIVAYYEQHSDDFSFPEKVHWQLLEITFDKHGGRDGALAVLTKAVDALKRGDSFDKVAKKYSDGLHADDGGKQPWTRVESVVDEKISKTLEGLSAGETSPVLSTRESYRLVRVMERKPAGKKPIGEVQERIKQILEEKIQKAAVRKVLVEAYEKASIESAYLPPEDLQPPADFAGIPASPKNSDTTTKKGRKRS